MTKRKNNREENGGAVGSSKDISGLGTPASLSQTQGGKALGCRLNESQTKAGCSPVVGQGDPQGDPQGADLRADRAFFVGFATTEPSGLLLRQQEDPGVQLEPICVPSLQSSGLPLNVWEFCRHGELDPGH